MKKILVTGGDGRFARELKKIRTKLEAQEVDFEEWFTLDRPSHSSPTTNLLGGGKSIDQNISQNISQGILRYESHFDSWESIPKRYH